MEKDSSRMSHSRQEALLDAIRREEAFMFEFPLWVVQRPQWMKIVEDRLDAVIVIAKNLLLT